MNILQSGGAVMKRRRESVGSTFAAADVGHDGERRPGQADQPELSYELIRLSHSIILVNMV